MVAPEAEERHQRRLAAVVEQVRQARRLGVPYRKVKRVTKHVVPDTHAAHKPGPGIDITRLNEILDIDPDAATCVAEPGVTFEELVRATLKVGFVPYTVPEHRQITVGGAVSGCSLESMSHKHGGFHDHCLEYEAVAGTAEVMTCSRDHEPELFEMLHGSYGTMAVLTKIKFELCPAGKYVHVENRRFDRFADYWAFLAERCARGEDHFIDGIVHAPDLLVACIGNMVDEAPYANRYDRLKVYYRSTRELTEDYLDTEQYFFRYDADLHWLTRTVPALEHWLPRLLLGRFVLGSSNVIRLAKAFPFLFRLGKLRPDLVLDVFIPSRRFPEFFDWYARELDYWPLWLVPYRAPRLYPWLSDEHVRKMGESLLIDCAVYGKTNNDPHRDLSELLERRTAELGGIKTLITRNHYSEEDFWKIYSRPRYVAAKSRLDPNDLFGDLYRKMGNYRNRPE